MTTREAISCRPLPFPSLSGLAAFSLAFSRSRVKESGAEEESMPEKSRSKAGGDEMWLVRAWFMRTVLHLNPTPHTSDICKNERVEKRLRSLS